MLLAIDVGNSETDFGLWDGISWVSIWRRKTDPLATPVEIHLWLRENLLESGISMALSGAIYSSVVPAASAAVSVAVLELAGKDAIELRLLPKLGLAVDYDPPGSAGADRIANALGALTRYTPPILVVDVGTATTFDAIDASGTFVGGAIMPGPELGAAALATATAKLPFVPLVPPPSAIGGNTVHAMQSGLVLGYAAAIDGLAGSIAKELGPTTTIVATGGFGELFFGLCPAISTYVPTLTLDGLIEAFRRLSAL